jgi:hypothetical protein
MPIRRQGVTTLALALAGWATAARAQIPEASVPDMRQRSGLVQRQTRIEPHLPPDPKRDQWYDTRWADPPNRRKCPNWYVNNGIYGLPWRDNYTKSIHPYFFGAPGRDTLTDKGNFGTVHNVRQLGRSMFHQLDRFKPIGIYYDQGSYVPIYDLDPIVPGPGPWPWPWFRRLTSAGG